MSGRIGESLRAARSSMPATPVTSAATVPSSLMTFRTTSKVFSLPYTN